MRTIKAIIGNYISRLTFGTMNYWVDEEWNASQLKIPNKNSWVNLIIIFPLLLIFLMLTFYFLFR